VAASENANMPLSPAALPTPSPQLHDDDLGLLLPQHSFPPRFCRLQNTLFCYAEPLEAWSVMVELGGNRVERRVQPQAVELNLDDGFFVGCHQVQHLTSAGLLVVVGQDWQVTVLGCWEVWPSTILEFRYSSLVVFRPF